MTSVHNTENRAPGSFRVADFTRYMPGPMAGRLLRDLGAEIIKVENPRTGDATRGFAPYIHGEGLFHVSLNAGIRSLAMSSRAPEWKQVIEALARWADVMIVGGLPEGLEKLGIDFDALVKVNPRIVHCNVTGYGEKGPLCSLPAHGLNPDAYAGIVPLDWKDGLPYPQAMYQSAGAPLAGAFAALGILAALRRRDETGEPQRLSVSLYGAAVWWNWRHVGAYANLGEKWFSYGDFGGRYATYETSDRKIILVCPIEKVFWEAFCTVLGLPEDWKARGAWGRSEMDHGMDYPWERAEIAERIREKPRDHWEKEFVRVKIPFACVLSLEETLASEQIGAIEAMREVSVNGRTAKIPSMPVQFAKNNLGGPLKTPMRTPALGEHTQQILAELGVSTKKKSA
jgi:crotonobetainyl-CoA:carnitine CoA-transferase CaiB-like acyl-CoA transferase